MMPNKPSLYSFFAILACAGLSACGGGGGSSNNTGPRSNEIDLARFNEILYQSGAALLTYDGDIQLRSTFSSPNQSIEVDFSLQTSDTIAVNINTLSNNEVSICSSTVNTETDPFDLSTREDFFEFFSFTDTSELPESLCENYNVRYFSPSDSSASMQFFCGNDQVATINYERIAEQANTRFGSFSLSSPQLADVNSNNVQCASIFNINESIIYSPQPNQLELINATDNLNYILIEVPYGTQGHFLEMSIAFDEPVTTTTYQIENNSPFVYLESYEFGMTNGEANFMTADSGTITISSVSSDAIIGTYNIVAEGNTLSGSFSIDLN